MVWDHGFGVWTSDFGLKAQGSGGSGFRDSVEGFGFKAVMVLLQTVRLCSMHPVSGSAYCACVAYPLLCTCHAQSI